MDEYSDSNSGDELELMALAVALAAKMKKKRKHLVWVKEIFQDRKKKESANSSTRCATIERETFSRLHFTMLKGRDAVWRG